MLPTTYASVVLHFLFSSDEFIPAQQQLARWASEDAVGQARTSGGSAVPREYYRSPSSSISEEPTSCKLIYDSIRIHILIGFN
ncbi:hypothetical protein QE152_g30151 [Popillia japonica]|uniref:Uncharacterized protein n=1 Tax=Popillia japonica TaxID=7064 RepID=A0AAW1JFW7_POPJA